MNFAAEISKVVTKMVKHIQREAGRAVKPALRRQLLDGSWSTHARAKRARSASARGRRHCRGCGSVKHDLRNCDKKGARNGKR